MHAFQPANPEVRKKKESRDILTAPKVLDIFFFFLPSRLIHSCGQYLELAKRNRSKYV